MGINSFYFTVEEYDGDGWDGLETFGRDQTEKMTEYLHKRMVPGSGYGQLRVRKTETLTRSAIIPAGNFTADEVREVI